MNKRRGLVMGVATTRTKSRHASASALIVDLYWLECSIRSSSHLSGTNSRVRARAAPMLYTRLAWQNCTWPLKEPLELPLWINGNFILDAFNMKMIFIYLQIVCWKTFPLIPNKISTLNICRRSQFFCHLPHFHNLRSIQSYRQVAFCHFNRTDVN